MSEVNYELNNPFEYAYKGDTRTAGFITLNAPSYKSLEHSIPIKQSFTSAITDMASDAEEQAAAPTDTPAEMQMTARQVLQVMYASSADMVKVMVHAQQLFRSGIALIDGETAMTQPLIDKMSGDDFELLLGTFVANFIAPSLLDGQ